MEEARLRSYIFWMFTSVHFTQKVGQASCTRYFAGWERSLSASPWRCTINYLIIVIIARKVKDQMYMQIISYIYFLNRSHVVQEGWKKIYWIIAQVAREKLSDAGNSLVGRKMVPCLYLLLINCCLISKLFVLVFPTNFLYLESFLIIMGASQVAQW